MRRPLDILRTLAKMLLRRRLPEWDLFEPSGNYVYRLSERDIFRMLTAMQLHWFAVRTFNDFYLRWLADKKRSSMLAQVSLNWVLAFRMSCPPAAS